MLARPYLASDLLAVAALYRAGGYGFDMPSPESLLGATVIEHDGRIVAFAGAHVQAEIIMLLHVEQSPHLKISEIANLHIPILAACEKAGIEKTYAEVDTERHRGFGKRLMAMGWLKSQKEIFSITAAKCREIFGL